MKTYDLPEAATAIWLADQAAEHGDTAFLVRGVARLERLARACAGFCAGRVELLVLPPWDVLPYDPVPPTPRAIGRRVQTLARLSGPRSVLPRLVLVSAGAALQRVPGAARWADVRLGFAVGDQVDREAIAGHLSAAGYHLSEFVSDAGDVAIHEHVIDVFPAGAVSPARLSIEHDTIVGIHALDPISQRSLGVLDRVEAFPATEIGGEAEKLVPVFDYLAGFRLFVDDGVRDRWAELREQIEDAHENSRRLQRSGIVLPMVLPPPEQLYLSSEEAEALIARGAPATPGGRAEPVTRRVAELIERIRGATVPVVIAAPADPAKLARSLAKRGIPARAADGWPDAVSGGVTCWHLDVDGGFRTDGLLVLDAAHLVRHTGPTGAELLAGDHALRIGDIVVHAEHGTARLMGLKDVELQGARSERLALEFAGGMELLIDPLELDRVWRYGTSGTLDHLHGEAWRSRRIEIESEIHVTAARLTDDAAARARRQAPIVVPDRGQYEKLSLRFPHPLSGDQRAAVDAVLADLRRGSPMNRLVCGDVGFGKTEVALRAMAAVALSGFQVALVAPTTVLARQHLDTVRRRFVGTGLRVEGLLNGADTGAVRAGLADGSIGVVVGTQALAMPDLVFARLGLVVVDEEQRFGEEQKQALADRTNGDGVVHSLVMTATPIPRTMQAALVGLREVSVIATAPISRQATRTLVQPFDAAVMRDALLRERARGGQSFIVCPRIADLQPIAALLEETVPELHVVMAHGKMPAEALEDAVVGFAAGAGDVLLATNIIEAGLDVPRANTLVVLHPDRFGLAQLHQIRGRVGRGARRGTAYLMTDPDRPIPAPTTARLRALESMSGLGGGIAISAADMDQRGAGELFGSVQAGHVTALGTEMYQHLLTRALKQRQGASAHVAAPQLHVGLHGCIPAGYVHDADLRIALYRRLARLEDMDAIEAFAEELADRFGPVPAETDALLALARLRCVGLAAGVKHLESGPKGVSILLHDGETPLHLAQRLSVLAERLGGMIRDDRLVVKLDHAPPHHRVGELIALLSG